MVRRRRDNEVPDESTVITSFGATLLRTIKPDIIIEEDPEANKRRRQQALEVIDVALDKFAQNLREDRVELTSTLDLDRLVRLMIHITGGADLRFGKEGSTEETTLTGGRSETAILKEVLESDESLMKEVYQRAFAALNTRNDS